MITTTLGDMDERELDCKRGSNEDDDVRVEWVEYRLFGDDEIIHRSVHVHVKKGLLAQVTAGGAG